MAADLKALGGRIRTWRIAKGFGLGELAERLGISKGYLSALETTDDANPTLDVLQRIAEALDLTIADLFGNPATAAKQTVPEKLPQGLIDLVRERKAADQPLESATILWLAGARFRGAQPRTKEDFGFLLRSLQATTAKEKG